MKKYKNKYRTNSLRLQGYDYSSAGLYFLTICTEKRYPFFGKIQKGVMELNTSGEIVVEEWTKTSEIRGRVQLGEWIIMPNHVHGIIFFKPKQKDQCRDASNASQIKEEGYKNKFGPQRDNISSIVRGFKSSCTRKIRDQSNKSFAWQKGFHDHIIRNQESLLKIEQYIRENPYRWYDDKYHC